MRALLAIFAAGCTSTLIGTSADVPTKPDASALDAPDDASLDAPDIALGDVPVEMDVAPPVDRQDGARGFDVRDAASPDVQDVVTEDDDVPGPAAIARTRPRLSCEDPTAPTCGVAWVRGGRFDLGPGTRPWETPTQRATRVSAFEIDRYEVTVARFRRSWREIIRRSTGEGTDQTPLPAVVYPRGQSWSFYRSDIPSIYRSNVLAPRGATRVGEVMVPPDLVPRATWSDAPEGREDRPIVGVWVELAQLFCVLDGGRLPTEAEWEWVARWLPDGRPTPRRYAWGDDAPDCARAHRASCDSGDVPAAVGSRPPTGLFYDLSGNVAELTADEFAFYTSNRCWGDRQRADPLCRYALFGQAMVARGGSYRAGDALDNVARAQELGGILVSPYVGFRCAYPPS